MSKTIRRLLAVSLSTSLILVPFVVSPAFAENTETQTNTQDSSSLKLRIMETTDIHTNIVNYDYYKDTATQEYGLALTASLIKAEREKSKNSLLFDNGDLIQGNPLGDYQAKINPLKDGETHAVFKAMNLLNYDLGNVGNHEFNFGLEHLDRSLDGANFPYVNANVYVDDHDQDPSNDKNYFTPYQILDKTFVDEAGQEQTLKVGVIGFVPPQIMQWDKGNLEGKVIAKDMVETAKKFIPEMKEKGADIIVAIPHSGLEATEAKGNDENAVYYLSQVDGIDAILFGHAHKVFPSKDFKDMKGVDSEKGTINGVAAVEPGFWGDNLGMIDMTLEKVDGKWKVTNSQSTVLPVYDKANKKAMVEPDQEILDAVKAEHEATLAYVRGPVGTTEAPINSFFALVQDDPSIQIVNNAQKWYVEKNIQGTEFEGIPVLSAGAPFKAGGRGGSDYYTDIPVGTIAIKNVADLYLYPNTLKAVLLDGSQVKEWLEMSAGQFNQIDPNKTEEQSLINVDFPTYNFDVIDGVTYQIDVTEPVKYDKNGQVVNPQANRIQNLQFNGKEIKNNDKFIVVTNNYRASGGGHFPGLDGSNIIIDSPDENRQVVIDYIQSEKTINPTADQNWSFAPIAGKAKVSFETSPKAKELVKEGIQFVEALESGFGKYMIELPVKEAAETPAKAFTDVPATHWASQVINELVEKKIVSGVSETNFEPERSVTRAEFAALLVRTLDLKASKSVAFSDVDQAKWFAPFVAAANEAGIVSGRSNEKFDPNATITREEMAAMIVRAYEVKSGKKVELKNEKAFADAKDVSKWAVDFVNGAAELELVKGRGENKFVPKGLATRAESAQMIFNLLSK